MQTRAITPELTAMTKQKEHNKVDLLPLNARWQCGSVCLPTPPPLSSLDEWNNRLTKIEYYSSDSALGQLIAQDQTTKAN